MKILSILLLGFGISYLGPCSSEQPADMDNNVPKVTGTQTGSSFTPEILTDDYLVSVYEKQELIKISHTDRDLRKAYCESGYLKDYGVFISMGIGSLKNPQTGQSISQNFALRAANLDARRWASYGEGWLKNNYEPDFGKMNTFFQRQVEVVDQSIVGDSLFVFIATHIRMKSTKRADPPTGGD